MAKCKALTGSAVKGLMSVDNVNSLSPTTVLSYAVVTCEIKSFWNDFEIISVFYLTRNQFTAKLFQTDVDEGCNNFEIIILFHM